MSGLDGAIQSLLKPGDVEEGIVVRIESYGAFVELPRVSREVRRAIRGLVHISELCHHRVENVQDVVNLDDRVQVRVLSCDERSSMGRLQIKLSMNLDGHGSSDRGGGLTSQAAVALESNLTSAIGMGVARDPMESSGLILKQPKASQKIFNGYALVGPESEPEEEPLPPKSQQPQPTIRNDSAQTKLPSVGRGRGATLPSWMTNPAHPDRLGTEKNDNNEDLVHGRSDRRSRSQSTSSSGPSYSRRRRKSRKEHRRKEKKRKRSSRYRKEERRSHKKRKRHSRERSSSSSSDRSKELVDDSNRAERGKKPRRDTS